MLVNQLTDGQDVDLVLLVRDREVRTSREGDEYLKLSLGDRTGAVSALIRDGVSELRELCPAGAAVRVEGSYSVNSRYGPQLAVRGLRAAEPHEVDMDRLCDGPPRSAAQMEADLREILGTIHNPHLRALLDAIFGPHTPHVGAVPRRARRQALPPGLPPWPARAQPVGGAVGVGHLRELPGHRS